jgi:hypothetical protein
LRSTQARHRRPTPNFIGARQSVPVRGYDASADFHFEKNIDDDATAAGRSASCELIRVRMYFRFPGLSGTRSWLMPPAFFWRLPRGVKTSRFAAFTRARAVSCGNSPLRPTGFNQKTSRFLK